MVHYYSTSIIITTSSCPSDLHELFCCVLPATKRAPLHWQGSCPSDLLETFLCLPALRVSAQSKGCPSGPSASIRLRLSLLYFCFVISEVAPRALSAILYHVPRRAASLLPVAGEARLPGRRARGRARRGAAVQSKHHHLPHGIRPFSERRHHRKCSKTVSDLSDPLVTSSR